LPPLLLPSGTSLPLSAALLACIRLAYLSSPPLLVLSHALVGALEGLVPLAVIFGAVLLFESMAATGCLQFLMANVRCLSAGSPIAEVFLIGWAFAYTISGERCCGMTRSFLDSTICSVLHSSSTAVACCAPSPGATESWCHKQLMLAGAC
jgi:L-lactate permease